MPDINRLQPFQRNSGVYQSLFDSENTQFDTRNSNIIDLQNQMDVDTATWGLSYYESDYNITPGANDTYDERRSVIKAKMRGVGKVDADLIKNVADSFTNGNVDVSFSNSTITVTFTSIVGTPPNESQFKLAIDEIKPCHLAIVYVYLYNKWSVIANYTWSHIDTYTWEQVMSETIS